MNAPFVERRKKPRTPNERGFKRPGPLAEQSLQQSPAATIVAPVSRTSEIGILLVASTFLMAFAVVLTAMLWVRLF